MLSTFLFIYLAKQENNKTLTIQNQRIFSLIFVQQFISVAIVQVYTEQDFKFDTIWFSSVGTTLCMTVLINIFSTKVTDLLKVIKTFGKRLYDRFFKCSNKKAVK